MCELLSREVLVPADPARDALEVVRLRFQLPPGAQPGVPPAHVKVRAPDAPGQTGRVRAYSMLLGAGDAPRAFNLTVKVYPGGPPRSRGTSNYLGGVAVGESVHVPQTRTVPFAEAPAGVRRAGMVAFGVGIAECLEPMEELLRAGAEVRLLYASRDEASIVHAEELRALLAAHASLRVHHFLSRQHREEAAVCATSERFSLRRIDEEAVADEFAEWVGSSARFLVVGTGQMEHRAEAWLRRIGFGGREGQLMQGGGSGWSPLVPA
jgi:ferredoxin-NADP reductase